MTNCGKSGSVLYFLLTLGPVPLAIPAWAANNPAPMATNATNSATPLSGSAATEPAWNWHVQNTDIGTFHPGFAAPSAGPNSLYGGTDWQETVSLDLLVGARLWHAAEFHVDGMMWQGFGFSKTVGIEGFPNAEAFRVGTRIPNVDFTRMFIRQSIDLGGETVKIADDALHLAGQRDASNLTLTLGKFSAKDIFDNNAYANDARSQFMSWSLVANEAWDYPADSLGYTTGLAAEFNQPEWAVRYGFFQVPRVSNGLAEDTRYLDAWGMVAEFERRYSLASHPGAVRLLAFLNRSHMGVYQAAIDNPGVPANDALALTRDYRFKYGFGLNLEQELAPDLGAFVRLGWSDGKSEAWMFADVDHALSLGLSAKGTRWGRPNDTLGLAGAANGITRVHQNFLTAGGTGILAGDGRLIYGIEELLECYYDFQFYEGIHFALDYQFVANPAFNRDRGPVSVFSARLHWEF